MHGLAILQLYNEVVYYFIIIITLQYKIYNSIGIQMTKLRVHVLKVYWQPVPIAWVQLIYFVCM